MTWYKLVYDTIEVRINFDGKLHELSSKSWIFCEENNKLYNITRANYIELEE